MDQQWYVCGYFELVYFVLEVVFVEYVVMVVGEYYDGVVGQFVFFQGCQQCIDLCVDVVVGVEVGMLGGVDVFFG